MNDKLISLIKDRLELQSVKRLLGDFYKLKDISYAFLTSDTFVLNQYSQWNDYRKRGFAQVIAGNFLSNYNEVIKFLNNKQNKE